MLNINDVKSGFSDYLNNINESSEKNYTNNVSIFNYSNEFKNYVTDELGLDTNGISLDIASIDNLEIENGELIDPNNDSEESFMIQFANSMLDIEEIKDSVDKNHDGEISDSEYKSFLDEVNDEDQNYAKLTMDKFLKFMQDSQTV